MGYFFSYRGLEIIWLLYNIFGLGLYFLKFKNLFN